MLKEELRQPGRALAAVVAGLAASTALAALWNTAGWAPPSADVGYELSSYFIPFSAGFFIAWVATAFILGWLVRMVLAVALGMVLPLPAATWVEMSRDPTSHNLIPFEILIFWGPLFLLAGAAAFAGRAMQRRRARGSSEATPLP